MQNRLLGSLKKSSLLCFWLCP